jgi:hypothetical protein
MPSVPQSRGSAASAGGGVAPPGSRISDKSDTVNSMMSDIAAIDNVPATSEIAKQIRADKKGEVARRCVAHMSERAPTTSEWRFLAGLFPIASASV